MHRDITMFISRDRAERVAEQNVLTRETYKIEPGNIRWHSGGVDNGFAVKVFNERGRFVRFL